LHPEVKNVGLLTLLFAGTPYLCFKYTFLIGTFTEIVIKLKQRKSAGNVFYIKNGTSETIRSKIVVNSENVKRVSDHVPKHLKPLNDEQLGHYLAGLIDGHGQFANKGLILTFKQEDASLAYYIKTQIGYGHVWKSRYFTYHLEVSNEKGLARVIELINGKLKKKSNINELVKNISKPIENIYPNINIRYPNIHIITDLNYNFDNHWFAGFCDVYCFGLFQINKFDFGLGIEDIGLNFKMYYYNLFIITLVKCHLGGNISRGDPFYISDTSRGWSSFYYNYDTFEGWYNFYYNSVSMGSAKNVINYFDKYHLQSKKHISYLRWRKVYRLIQDKEHLTEERLAKILKIDNYQIEYKMANPSFRAL
jgi:hypothetical protein